MANKSVLPRGFKAEAEKLSLKYRADLNLAKTSPLCAFKLAEYLGIIVAPFDFLNAEDREKLAEEFSALWFTNVDGHRVILHNSLHSPFRQQSNLMHEIAHIVRDHQMPEEVKKYNLPSNLYYYNALQEEEASYLGSCLQLPREALLWASRQKWSDQEISKYYNASTDMVRFRINATGISKQVNYYYKKSTYKR